LFEGDLAMNINCHSVRKITADAFHRENTHWIELRIHERDDGALIVLYLDDPAKVDAYASAISAANDAAIGAAAAPTSCDGSVEP
jgi:hypothetical protein